MKKFTALTMMILAASVLVSGCSDDDDDSPIAPITASDFENYTEWTQVEYTNAPSAFLGAAHQGSDPEFTRAIYTNATATSGDYPVGTIFVKQTFTHDAQGNPEMPAAMGLLGMIKRSPGFDTGSGDWEYFNIDPSDLSTIDSGADLGSCKGCHTSATGNAGNDFIFKHPYEFEAVAADFDDFASWNLIDTAQGADALLGAAHAGNDENAVRKIYKKQLQAKPVTGAWNGYPVGTLLLKTVHDADNNLIGKTAMAKRGGLYDPTHGGWEYFMMDMDTEVLMPMGENSSMCISCHTGANVGSNGQDYVFAHQNDPFNN